MNNTKIRDVNIKPLGEALEVNGANVNFDRLGVDEYRIVQIFGENSAVNGTERIIGPGVPLGTVGLSFPASLRLMSVASTSVNDTNGGSGAHLVQIIGLDAAGIEQNDIILLNGQTPVNSAKQYLRVNTIVVFSAGSVSRGNEGFIYLSDDTDTFVLGVPQTRLYRSMTPFTNLAKSALYSVPITHTLNYQSMIISSDASAGKRFRLKMYIANFGLNNVDMLIENHIISDGLITIDLSTLFLRQPGSDLFITAQTIGGGGTVDLNVKVGVIIHKN